MKLKQNAQVVKKDRRDKVYCQEEYAQDMYDRMSAYWTGREATHTKDFTNGQVVDAEVTRVGATDIEVSTGSGELYLDRKKEQKFFESQGIEPLEGMQLSVQVVDKNRSTASASGAFAQTIKRELHDAQVQENSAYSVTIKQINDGGFLVDLSGLTCFMPGSLAAANKITDFESMIGKKVNVMVESYLDRADMFVVSAKKYIKKILPERIKELDPMRKYTGTVTGTAKYGTFVEWDEIFTGLLHESESEEPLSQHKRGQQVEFYVKEVRQGDRIILSQKGPSPEALAFEEFSRLEDTVQEGRVVDIKDFGVFIDFGSVTGMMTPKEFRRYRGVSEGDTIEAYVKKVDLQLRKIHLKKPEPTMSDKLEQLKNKF